MARALEITLGMSLLTNNIRGVTNTTTKVITADNVIREDVTVPISATTTTTVPFSSLSSTVVVLTNQPVTVSVSSGSPSTVKTFAVKNMLVFEDSLFTQIQIQNTSAAIAEVNVVVV